MSKFVAVASQFLIYEIPDETFEVLPGGKSNVPPQVVLEVMVLNNQAKRIGSVGTLTMDMADAEEFLGSDDEEDPPEGAGPWISGETG